MTELEKYESIGDNSLNLKDKEAAYRKAQFYAADDIGNGNLEPFKRIENKLLDVLMRQQMSIIGSIKSGKKAKASAENGKKGGRPKKINLY